MVRFSFRGRLRGLTVGDHRDFIVIGFAFRSSRPIPKSAPPEVISGLSFLGMGIRFAFSVVAMSGFPLSCTV